MIRPRADRVSPRLPRRVRRRLPLRFVLAAVAGALCVALPSVPSAGVQGGGGPVAVPAGPVTAQDGGEDDRPVLPPPVVLQRVDLARAAWTRDGAPADTATATLVPPPAPALDDSRGAVPREGPWALVELALERRGRRWATTFDTEGAAVVRLALDWRPGPGGRLLELVIDGERLPPPRDAWRPTPRRVVSDLGPRFLGAGEHLLEFVAREEGAGELELSQLVLTRP